MIKRLLEKKIFYVLFLSYLYVFLSLFLYSGSKFGVQCGSVLDPVHRTEPSCSLGI